MENKVVIFWFRRDLRLDDNVGLTHALKSGFRVLPVFIFDTTILNLLENKYDRRVDYIHQVLTLMNEQLHQHGSGIKTFHGTPSEVFDTIATTYAVEAVYCNHDYEPDAIRRDLSVKKQLSEKGIAFHSFKDQVVFEKGEVVKSDRSPYTVFTPYAKKWKETLQINEYSVSIADNGKFVPMPPEQIHSLSAIGFEKTDMKFSKPSPDESIVKNYHLYRDFPAMNLTTYLGIALRFGTISVRQCVDFARKHNETWLNELIWREFFMQILYHYPQVVNTSFKPQYDFIQWRNNEEEFARWCEGTTGYPIVDAGMRQLNETGFMHNRVRMIVASFLCKHLLIDWRWGEAYFAEKLNDYDLSANNGNWQWAAGCGCDAAPYFRIFNPTAQTQKFDKNLEYTRTWNPDFELAVPIIDHQAARERALKTYGAALKKE